MTGFMSDFHGTIAGIRTDVSSMVSADFLWSECPFSRMEERTTAGLGLYICPDMFLKKMDISEKFYTIPLNIEYTVSTAYRKKTYQSRLIEEFIQILKQKEL